MILRSSRCKTPTRGSGLIFNGEVILNNSGSFPYWILSGMKIKFTGNDEFFKLVTERIDINKPRWDIGNRIRKQVFAACVCADDKGARYINIYGKDITDRRKLKMLLQTFPCGQAIKNGCCLHNPMEKSAWE